MNVVSSMNEAFESAKRMEQHEIIKNEIKNGECYIYLSGKGTLLVGGKPKELLSLSQHLAKYLEDEFVKDLIEGVTNEVGKKSLQRNK